MTAQELIQKLKAAIPVNASLRFYRNRLLCELSDEDYNDHLSEVIKGLQQCLDLQSDRNVPDQYVWLFAANSRKSLMIKLWGPGTHYHFNRL